METSYILWGLGILSSVVAAGIVAHSRMSERVTKLETLMSIFTANMAKVFHSPDNHHGLDYYFDEYLRRGYDLPDDMWRDVRDITNEHIKRLEEDKTHGTDGFRVLVSWLNSLATHKLMRVESLLKPKVKYEEK